MTDEQQDGFFDLQVNGYAGVDFNGDDLSGEQLDLACARLADDGVVGVLAALITDDVARMAHRLERLVALREQSSLARRVIVGFHVEGPFINGIAGFRGAHPERFIRPADPDAGRRLLEAGAGLVRMVTLAPECDAGLAVTRMLVDAGVAVAAGHCDPSLDELEAAIDAGLTMFTHLGNGCPLTMGRHDNIIQRVLALGDRLRITFIADGVHIPFFALGNFLARVGRDRAIVVTDAMPAAALGPGTYRLGEREVVVGPDMIAHGPDGYLAGSTATMALSAANLKQHLALSDETVRMLTSTNPRLAIGLASEQVT